MYKYMYSSEDIFAMSNNRKKAIALIDCQEDRIGEHTAKLVMYSDIRKDDVHGWVRSIAKAFNEVSKVTIKPKGRRFNPEEYEEMILGMFGEDDNDLSCFLAYWETRLSFDLQRNPYPEHDLNKTDVEICKKYFELYLQFCEDISITESEIPYTVFYNKINKIRQNNLLVGF